MVPLGWNITPKYLGHRWSHSGQKSHPWISWAQMVPHRKGLSSSFQQIVDKSVGFCEKLWKLTDLAETSNFSCKLPCFRIFKFSAKRLQKVWDFVKNYENSSISPKLGFCEKPLKLIDLAESRNFSCKLPRLRFSNFQKTLQKMRDFVENRQNSPIWPKLGFLWKTIKTVINLTQNTQEFWAQILPI